MNTEYATISRQFSGFITYLILYREYEGAC